MKKLLQITSGRGPAECGLVAAQVLKRLLREAGDFGLDATVVGHENGGENGTVETAVILVSGKDAERFSASWTGTVQWIGQSMFRKFSKRKNWFVGIFESEMDNATDVSEKDIRYQAMRSSGAGGQHVNKVSSAIRAIHEPTGIAAVAMDSRSQHQNKKLARERLMDKPRGQSLRKMQEQFQTHWNNQLQVQRGNPTRIFEGAGFKEQLSKKENIEN